MKQPILSLWLITLLSLLGACATPQPAVTRVNFSRVATVKTVSVHRVAGGLEVTATGTAKSTGWTDPRLMPVKNYPLGLDYQLEFVARPPFGANPVILTPITASFTIRPLPAHISSVTVLSVNNQRTASVH